MINNNTKRGEIIFAIIGNQIKKCIFENFMECDKFIRIKIISEKKCIFKQNSYCYSTEKKAMEGLRNKLEKDLDEVCFKLSQL